LSHNVVAVVQIVFARRGILPGRKLGRTWRFLRPELEDAIQRLPKPSS
jgi:hypothetical protein